MKKLPKSCLFLALAGCLSLASCKKSMPSDVIQPAEMEAILYDYHWLRQPVMISMEKSATSVIC